jgi:hypothetical protein
MLAAFAATILRMQEATSADSLSTLVIEAHGVRLAVTAPDGDVLERIVAGLPAGWAMSPAGVSADSADWRFAVLADNGAGYRIRDGNGGERSYHDLEIAIGLLRRQLLQHVGHHAPDLVFVHAGVVASHGRAIVLPGLAFTGKSTLVAALVRAGATYYSDEYAVLDDQGLVRPYRERLAMTDSAGRHAGSVTAARPGGVVGEDPVPVGVVALTTYTPGAEWRPRRLSTGEGVIVLMANAIPRERPQESLATFGRALQDAVVFQGERGEAEEAAAALLEAAVR